MSKKNTSDERYNIGKAHYDMMRRCYNPKCKLYETYGAKGITVCPEWHDRDTFREWAIKSGFKKGLRLNRKDTSKGYSPDNCFWGDTHKAKDHKMKFYKSRAAENKMIKTMLGCKRITDSPVYGIYKSMHTRCENPNHVNYMSYGGRGIKVCPEWCGKEGLYNFIAWAYSSGWKEGLTLDRKDNDKGYSPDNCRWTDWDGQADNRRTTIHYTYKGQTLNLSKIARLENISDSKLRYRIQKGMTIEEAVNDIKSKIKEG